MNTVHKKYIVENSKISFLKFIFEAYDGVAVITSLDRKIDAEKGLIRFAIAPDYIKEADEIIQYLKKDIKIEQV